MQLITCSCLFGGFYAKKKLPIVKEMTKKFQNIQKEVVSFDLIINLINNSFSKFYIHFKLIVVEENLYHLTTRVTIRKPGNW